MKVEDVAQAGVVEAEVQRLARRRVQDRLGGRGARALAHRLNRRLRPRRLDAIANRPVERGDLRRRRARLLGSYSLASLYSPSAASS